MRSSTSVGVIGTLASLCVVSLGCTKRNPDICCTSEADCDQYGLPNPTNCADDSLTCVNNACEPPPKCQANSDCSTPLLCDVADGICVTCLDSSTCGDLVCDQTSHSCRPCTGDDECPGGFCAVASMTCQVSIVPKYIPNACDTPATDGDLAISTDTTLDTGDAAVCTGGLIAQTMGPEICIVKYNSIGVGAGVTLTVRGTRAVALVADKDLTIAGTLDLDASGVTDGPGGGVVSSGGAELGSPNPVGGGGVGFVTTGGAGGNSTDDGGAANGGAATTPPTGQLVGGPRASGARGGGGGGAATMVSCTGTVTVTGTLSVNGGGGDGGDASAGGFGGGGGGHVSLQGRGVTMIGQAFANGGAGGAGGFNAPGNNQKGFLGADGARSTTCPLGIYGGNGGCLSSAPGNGTKLRSEGGGSRQPSGGGGSVGIFDTFTPLGVDAVVTTTAASPAFQPNGTIQTE